MAEPDNKTIAKTEGDELGAVLWRSRTIRICEKGISNGKKTILWDDVDRLYLDATNIRVKLLPSTSLMTLQVVARDGRKISLTLDTLPRKTTDGRGDFMVLYKMVVNRIMERQRAELARDLKTGKSISFQRFDLTPKRIEHSGITGSYAIELSHVSGCRFERGDLVVDYIDGRQTRQQKLGKASGIPNIHLIQAFLESLAKSNLNR